MEFTSWCSPSIPDQLKTKMISSNSYFGHLFDYYSKRTKYFEAFVLIMQIENNHMGSALWYYYCSCNSKIFLSALM